MQRFLPLPKGWWVPTPHVLMGPSPPQSRWNAHVECVLLHQLPLACPAPMHLVLTDGSKEELPASEVKRTPLFHCKMSVGSSSRCARRVGGVKP